MIQKLCRFELEAGNPRVGLLSGENSILDLSHAGIKTLSELFEFATLSERLASLSSQSLPRFSLSDVKLLSPVDRQEVWAVGVTYLRSKTARMEESDFSATAYDKVYDGPRPELFFKSIAEKVAGPGANVGIRSDAQWNVPEPELALVINSRGKLAGFTIGNDMSSRDIEGENLLYLPQAKIYDHSCALGPVITVGASETDARNWSIDIVIERGGTPMFRGKTSVAKIKRTFEELIAYLFRSQTFPHGAILLTGTGIVPPDGFTLQPDDLVRINISCIGTLENNVIVV